MLFTKTVVENLGKVFLNLGQAMILGGIASRFLKAEITTQESIIIISIGVYTIYVGLFFLSQKYP